MTEHPKIGQTVVINGIRDGGHPILRNRAVFPFRARVTDSGCAPDAFGFRVLDRSAGPGLSTDWFFSTRIDWEPVRRFIATEHVCAGDHVEIRGDEIVRVLPSYVRVLDRVPEPGETVEVWRSTHFDHAAEVNSIAYYRNGHVLVRVSRDTPFAVCEFERGPGDEYYLSTTSGEWLAEEGQEDDDRA